jgi:transposase
MMVSMDLESLEFIGKTENKARLHLRKYCWKKGHIFCVRCRSHKIYRIHSKRYRCKRCGYTFHDFTKRWLNKLNIPYKKWLWIIKLFELEVSARKTAEQVRLSYPTTLKAFDIIRYALIGNAHDADDFLAGEIELDESYFGGKRKGRRGRGAANKVPVFGIFERNGIVKVEVVKDVSARSLLEMTIKTVRRGSIVYTDRFRSYDALMFCGYRHLCVDHGKLFTAGKVYINGLEGFWSYAKERLIKFHGVSKKKFPLYLKEMEFRYNHRKENLFNLLTQNLTNLVPNLL